MAFLEDFSKKVQDVAFAAAEKSKEVAAVAAVKGKEVAAVASEKAQDAAESVKASVAIAGEQRAIEKNYRAIGEWYVSELSDEAPEAVADIIRAIRESQAKIAALQGQEEPVDAACCEVAEEPAAAAAPVETAVEASVEAAVEVSAEVAAEAPVEAAAEASAQE